MDHNRPTGKRRSVISIGTGLQIKKISFSGNPIVMQYSKYYGSI